MQSQRLFIAIKLPPRALTAFGDLIDSLRRIPSPARWVRKESIHITLKFLGDVPTSTIPSLSDALSNVAESMLPFEISSGLNCAFPNMKKPTVLWVGLAGEGLKSLNAVQSKVDDACESLGFAKETRPYRPHLTLCRIRKPGNLQPLLKAFQSTHLPPLLIPVDEIHLMRSELKSSGAVYTSVAEFELSGN